MSFLNQLLSTRRVKLSLVRLILTLKSKNSDNNLFSEKFKEKNPFKIDTIIIRNPDKWKVAKLPDFLIDDIGLQSHKTTVKKRAGGTLIQD